MITHGSQKPFFISFFPPLSKPSSPVTSSCPSSPHLLMINDHKTWPACLYSIRSHLPCLVFPCPFPNTVNHLLSLLSAALCCCLSHHQVFLHSSVGCTFFIAPIPFQAITLSIIFCLTTFFSTVCSSRLPPPDYDYSNLLAEDINISFSYIFIYLIKSINLLSLIQFMNLISYPFQ